MRQMSAGPRKQARQERVERQRRAIEQEIARRRRRRWLVIGGVVAAAVLGAAALLAPAFLAGARAELTGLEQIPGLRAGHVQGAVQYPQTPPAGGEHAPVWQNCGIYDQPIQNEPAVHSLEHGAAWITYRPDLPPDQVESLTRRVRGQTFLLLSPFPDLPAPIVASAWGRQLRLDSADDPRLGEFIRQFRLGKQAPEPGASCTGGTGQPIR